MALANSNPVNDLHDEVTCAICLDYFKDPVSIECGHCFCRACIVQTWRGIRTNFPCPQCRKTSKWKFLRPNRLLENVVEISNRLLFTQEKVECIKRCKKHQEPLKFYCQVDAEEICVICRESVYHRSHVVLPVEETTAEFKIDIQERLKALRSKVSDITKMKDEEEETALKLQDEILQKRKTVASEFEALRQLLADQEKHITRRLESMQKTVMQKHKDRISRLNVQLSTTQKTINDLEKNSAFCQELKASSARSNFEFEHFQPRDPGTCSQPQRNKSQPDLRKAKAGEATACSTNPSFIKDRILESGEEFTEEVATSSASNPHTLTSEERRNILLNKLWSTFPDPENDPAFPVNPIRKRIKAKKTIRNRSTP